MPQCLKVIAILLCSDAIDCGVLQDPFEGSVRLVDGHTQYGATAVYSCDRDGYTPYPDDSRICLSTGIWSGQVPECNIVDCGYPGDILNGNQSGEIYTFNAIVRFECDYGYTLNGSASLICENTGEWSDDVPTCDPVFCGNPGTPQNAQQTIVFNPRRTGDAFTVGTTVTYTCASGYEIRGSSTLVCMANGEWNATVPMCLLPGVDNIEVSITRRPALSSVTTSNALPFQNSQGTVPTPSVQGSVPSDEAEATSLSPASSFTLSSGAMAAIVMTVFLAILASVLFVILIGIIFWRRDTLAKTKVMPCKYINYPYTHQCFISVITLCG